MQYDERGFTTAADGTRLFYGVRGSGPGLVLLDGIGCDGWAWTPIQPHLALRNRVVHVHYRGHGDRTEDDIGSSIAQSSRIE